MAMIINAESLTYLKTLEDNKFDSCVTDPPYHLASIVKRFGSGQKGINNQDENKKIMRRKPLTKIQVQENTVIIAKFAVQLLILILLIGVIIYSLPS